MVVKRVELLVAHPSRPAPWPGQGRIVAPLGHAFAGQRVGYHVARPSQPAPWPGQGRIAAALGHAFAGQRVGYPVARPSQPAPWPGQGRIAAAGARIACAEGWAPCGAPESASAMAGTGADCCGSGARNDGGCAEGCGGIMTKSTPPGGGWGGACGGAEGGAPLSAGAKAGTGADCGASGARG